MMLTSAGVYNDVANITQPSFESFDILYFVEKVVT